PQAPYLCAVGWRPWAESVLVDVIRPLGLTVWTPVVPLRRCRRDTKGFGRFPDQAQPVTTGVTGHEDTSHRYRPSQTLVGDREYRREVFYFAWSRTNYVIMIGFGPLPWD